MRNSLFAAKRGSIETTDANPTKAQEGYVSPFGSLRGKSIQTSSMQYNIAEVNDGTYVADIMRNAGGLGDAVMSTTNDIGSTIAVAERPMYADQMLPFDITLAGASEYGASMVMRIGGVEILNEGNGISVDDVSNEMQFTFIARICSGWAPQKRIYDESFQG